MSVLRHRPGVRFDVIAPAGFRILGALDGATQACKLDLMITSGTDSHALPDPHATGEAYDVSAATLSTQQIAGLHAYLTKSLGPMFTVLYEVPQRPIDPTLRAICYVNKAATGPHFHLQRRKSTEFPQTPDPSEIKRA